MIFLWGLPGDDQIAFVRSALRGLGQDPILFDQRTASDAGLEFPGDDDRDGRLRLGGAELRLSDVTAIYMRPYATVQLPNLAGRGPDDPVYAHADALFSALTGWTEIAPVLVVNRSSAMESNGSKPYQLRLIEAHGFGVPDTLITTDPDAALEFWEKHQTVIYKSISGVRSVVAKLTRENAKQLALLRWCPTQFQQFIAGQDFRVHVVGQEVFASAITSAATDYRYAHRLGATVEVESCLLPVEIAERCRSLASALGLEVAGVDLRRREDGGWICFEVNPSPAFTFYQNATRQPIGLAIARLLIVGAP